MDTTHTVVPLGPHRLSVRHCRHAGGGGRPTLVFLHEGLGAITTWKDYPAALADALACDHLVYDRPGHGNASPLTAARTERYLHEEALNVLPGLLDATAIDRAVFVGHSDGGTISLLFAAAHPDRTVAVVSEAAHLWVDEVTLEGIREAVAAYEAGRLRTALRRHHGRQTETLFRAWSDTWLGPGFRHWSIREEIGAVRCPVLVIQGEADPYGEPEQARAIAAAVGEGGRLLLLPEVGHVPHREARERVLAESIAFLAPLLSR